MADPVRMAHNGNLRLLLDALDELLSASRHDEVDVSVLREESGDLGSGRDRLDECWGEGSGGEGLGDEGRKES
jgi:hypothetical protein